MIRALEHSFRNLPIAMGNARLGWGGRIPSKLLSCNGSSLAWPVVSEVLARLSRYWLVWGPESARAR